MLNSQGHWRSDRQENTLRAKKSLGQNFLTSEKIVNDIIDAADPTGDDIVLEIGPGKGILTRALLAYAGKVIAVEKDHRLIENLQNEFAKEISEDKFDLIEKDILEFDTSLLEFYDLPYKIVANIPYYITGQILRQFLTAKKKPSCMVLMVQKEVAERIIARGGRESLLSLSVKTFGTPKIIKIVEKSYFKPVPKVDSAILLIDNISNKFFENVGGETANRMSDVEKYFFSILHAGFSSKRKKLLGNLKNGHFGTKTELETMFERGGIPLDARAENLTLGQWRFLLEKIEIRIPKFETSSKSQVSKV